MNTDRVPPYNESAEASLLGAILIDASAVLFRCAEVGLTKHDFYVPAHTVIYAAMLEVAAKRGSGCMDILMLADALRDAGRLDSIGGEAYLHKCYDACTTVQYAQHYLDIVVDDAKRRAVLSAIRETEAGAWDAGRPVTDIVASFVERMLSLGAGACKRMKPADIHKAQQELWRRMQAGEMIGVPPACMAIRNIVYSYMPGDLIIIGGMPSDGKTMFALNEAEYAASVNEIPVAIGSMEMTEQQLRTRMACALAGVNSAKMGRPYTTDEDQRKVNDAFSVMESWPLHIEDTNRTIDGWMAWAVNMKARYNIGLFMFDYLQLINSHRDDLRRTRTEVVGDWSKAFKGLAKRLHLPVMVLSQFSRGERREHETTPPPPTLASLRDSGGIEQAADVAILLSKREGLAYAEFENNNEWQMTAGVDKNRNGPTGKVKMIMRRDIQRWVGEQAFYDERKPVDTTVAV